VLGSTFTYPYINTDNKIYKIQMWDSKYQYLGVFYINNTLAIYQIMGNQVYLNQYVYQYNGFSQLSSLSLIDYVNSMIYIPLDGKI
jgi:hypothetical protein